MRLPLTFLWGTCAMQRFDARAFATDGLHWGTGDLSFLRSVATRATVDGVTGIVLFEESVPGELIGGWVANGI